MRWPWHREKEIKPKRPYEDKSFAELHAALEQVAGGVPQLQIELEGAARQVEATESLHASSKRIEFGTWLLLVSSVLLLATTAFLLVVTLRR